MIHLFPLRVCVLSEFSNILFSNVKVLFCFSGCCLFIIYFSLLTCIFISIRFLHSEIFASLGNMYYKVSSVPHYSISRFAGEFFCLSSWKFYFEFPIVPNSLQGSSDFFKCFSNASIIFIFPNHKFQNFITIFIFLKIIL